MCRTQLNCVPFPCRGLVFRVLRHLVLILSTVLGLRSSLSRGNVTTPSCPPSPTCGSGVLLRSILVVSALNGIFTPSPWSPTAHVRAVLPVVPAMKKKIVFLHSQECSISVIPRNVARCSPAMRLGPPPHQNQADSNVYTHINAGGANERHVLFEFKLFNQKPQCKRTHSLHHLPSHALSLVARSIPDKGTIDRAEPPVGESSRTQ